MAGIRHHRDLTGVDLHVNKLHAATHLTGGTDPLGLGTASIADVPATGDASAIQVVLGDDSRLSDARTPSIHVHGEGDVTDLVTDLAAKLPKSLLTEQGDVIYASAVATPAALPHGIVGQVLQSGGHGANPSWLTLGTMAVAVATDYVPKSLFDAYSVLYADTDDTPARLTVGASTVVGRAAAGGIVALAKSDLLTLLNVADGANAYVHPNHSGDVTSVADGATTIVAGTVTLAKMANMATGSLIYRKTAAAGAPEVQTLATLKTDLGLTGTNSGDQTLASLGLDADLATFVLPASTTISAAGAALIDDAAASNQRTTLGLGTMAVETATDYLAKVILSAKGDIIAASAAGTPVVVHVDTDGQVLTADAASAGGMKWGNAGAGTVTAVTGTFPIVSSGGLTPAISLSDAGVTYAKMQNISATDKILGRVTAGAGSPEEIACTAAGRELINDADVAAQRATLGGVVVGPASFTDHAIVRADGVTGKLVQDSSVIIDDAGQVGIGTTAPGYKTEIVGGVNAATTRILEIRSNFTTTNTGTTLKLTQSTAEGAGAGSEITSLRTNVVGAGDSDLLFSTSSGSAQTERMRILASGNVGIGVASPNANAVLDVVSTTKAFMPPRMTTAQRDAIASPTEGMVIFNTTTHVLNFYYTSWVAV